VRVDVENVSNKSLRWRLSGRLAPSEPKKLSLPMGFASPWRVAFFFPCVAGSLLKHSYTHFSGRNTSLVISSARYMDDLIVFFKHFATRCFSDESLPTIFTFLPLL
jgi:hypothetical protein